MSAFPAQHNFWKVDRVCVEHLYNLINRLIVQVYTDCGEGIDDKPGNNIVDRLCIFDSFNVKSMHIDNVPEFNKPIR